jgi:chemotaxis protein CheD
VPTRPSSAAPGADPWSTPDAGGRRQVYLQAGQLVAAATPTVVTTVLGSCVAVCLHDPVAHAGGVNHFLLPHHVERERSARFGNVAIPELVAAVVRAGAARERLVAKVFGGASVLGGASAGRRLGEENARLALDLLEELGIPVLDGDLGGTRGRKLVFFTDEGVAWIRHL